MPAPGWSRPPDGAAAAAGRTRARSDGRVAHSRGMDGLGQAVGNGITGLVAGAFDAIGSVLRGMVNAGNQALPNGLFWVLIFVVLLIGGWTLVKR